MTEVVKYYMNVWPCVHIALDRREFPGEVSTFGCPVGAEPFLQPHKLHLRTKQSIQTSRIKLWLFSFSGFLLFASVIPSITFKTLTKFQLPFKRICLEVVRSISCICEPGRRIRGKIRVCLTPKFTPKYTAPNRASTHLAPVLLYKRRPNSG